MFDVDSTVVVNEQLAAVTVLDQDLNIPVTITEELVQADSDIDVILVEKKEEAIQLISKDETIEVEDGPDIISPIFQEVLIQTINSELEVPYSIEVDFVGDTIIYKGWSNPGKLTTEPAWRIQKITFVGTDEDVTIRWADGDGEFNNIWDNRLGLTYS
jgi:hypothetical protein